MQSVAIIDDETYSTLDLKKVGAYKYAAHDSTDVICQGGCLDYGPVDLWNPYEHGPWCPQWLYDHVIAGGIVAAFNAGFERAIWKYIKVPFYGWPEIHDEQWECLQARAAYYGLPRGLDKALKVIKATNQKDAAGKKLITQCCKPVRRRRQYKPELIKKLEEYCIKDVLGERELRDFTPPLPDREQKVWLAHTKINDRGVRIDRALCEGGKLIAVSSDKELDQKIHDLCDGRVTKPTQGARILAELQRFDIFESSLNKEKVADLLETDLCPEARLLLDYRQGGASTGSAKFASALENAMDDDRCYGVHRYYKAHHGRWAGEHLQTQNMRHGSPDEETLQLIRDKKVDEFFAKFEQPLDKLSECVRPLLKPRDGCKFIYSDFNAIEFRMACWLADETDLLEKLRAGADLYIPMAAKMYQVDPSEITKKDKRRAVGKEVKLGGIYGMGAKKLKGAVKKRTGIVLDDDFCQSAIELNRADQPRICSYWRELDRAVKVAMDRKITVRAGKATFGWFEGWFVLTLPSGRQIFYFEPRYEPDHKGRPKFTCTSPTGTKTLWGGTWTEHIASGSARDLEAGALLRFDAAGIPVVTHVHDSLVCEQPIGDTDMMQKVCDIMKVTPLWAKGLPIAAETMDNLDYIP